MTVIEIAINLALLVAVVFTQLGRRVVTRRRFTVPLIIVAVAGFEYCAAPPSSVTMSASTSLGLRQAQCLR
jgi:hypothetical protein